MGKLVFVVDDQIGIRLLLKEILTMEGYKVKEFDNAKEALKASSSLNPSLLFLDYNMPMMNGTDLAKQLHEQNEDIPIIIMSGYSEDELDGDLSLSNIKKVLQKPFDVTEVIALVKEYA